MLTDILIFHKRQQNRVHIKSESTLYETCLAHAHFRLKATNCTSGWSLVSCFPVMDPKLLVDNSDLPSVLPLVPEAEGYRD